jgi:hypothetical protein
MVGAFRSSPLTLSGRALAPDVSRVPVGGDAVAVDIREVGRIQARPRLTVIPCDLTAVVLPVPP